MGNFWADHLATPSAPEMPQAGAAAYRAHRRLTSGSRLYDEPVAKTRPHIYDPEAPVYSGLEQYSTSVNDKFARRAGESAEAWQRRVNNSIRHLPADQRLALETAIEAARTAEQLGSFEQLRTALDSRVEGTGYGITGADTPYDRAAIHGRFGGRQVEAQGHLALGVESIAQVPHLISGVEAAMVARQRAAEQAGLLPQRTTAPTGSSGSGFLGVDNRG